MNASTSSSAIALIAALLTVGCANTASPTYSTPEPVATTRAPTNNTARDAVGGAVAGAVVGGIIGNNSGGETTKGAVIGAAVGGLAGAAIGHQQDKREAAILAGDTQMVVSSPPPVPSTQPSESVPPRPAQNAVWIAGHYTYTGSGYVWESGRWEFPPAGAAVWTPPAWRRQGNGYVYVRGHWE